MTWKIEYLPEVKKDIRRLSGAQQALVDKSIVKVSQNPLPTNEGGYGKPLGNKGGRNLTGLLIIKLKDAGLRIVYKVIRTDTKMTIVVVGAREDEQVYDIAAQRAIKYNL